MSTFDGRIAHGSRGGLEFQNPGSGPGMVFSGEVGNSWSGHRGPHSTVRVWIAEPLDIPRIDADHRHCERCEKRLSAYNRDTTICHACDKKERKQQVSSRLWAEHLKTHEQRQKRKQQWEAAEKRFDDRLPAPMTQAEIWAAANAWQYEAV